MGKPNFIKTVHKAIIDNQAEMNTGNLYFNEKINYAPYSLALSLSSIMFFFLILLYKI